MRIELTKNKLLEIVNKPLETINAIVTLHNGEVIRIDNITEIVELRLRLEMRCGTIAKLVFEHEEIEYKVNEHGRYKNSTDIFKEWADLLDKLIF
jgi:hypothetical protein